MVTCAGYHGYMSPVLHTILLNMNPLVFPVSVLVPEPHPADITPDRQYSHVYCLYVSDYRLLRAELTLTVVTD